MAKSKKKKFKSSLIIIGLSLIAVGFVLAVIKLSSNYLDKQSGNTAKANQQCKSGNHTAHQVIIQNNLALPDYTSAVLCDTLTITNKDNEVKLMAFGKHDDHITYDGISEKALQPGQSFTVTLNQTGTFIFHDHISDQAQGSFAVYQVVLGK